MGARQQGKGVRGPGRAVQRQSKGRVLLPPSQRTLAARRTFCCRLSLFGFEFLLVVCVLPGMEEPRPIHSSWRTSVREILIFS